jgi:hypothetical protein
MARRSQLGVTRAIGFDYHIYAGPTSVDVDRQTACPQFRPKCTKSQKGVGSGVFDVIARVNLSSGSNPIAPTDPAVGGAPTESYTATS